MTMRAASASRPGPGPPACSSRPFTVNSARKGNRMSGRVMFIALLAAGCAAAQVPGGRGGPPLAPQAAAVIDVTGYWVSMVNEDWRWRMVTPPKGDYASIPLNAEGKKTADAWDPVRDETAGLQCKAYGAAGLMRLPIRMHIAWADDKTLKLETDA